MIAELMKYPKENKLHINPNIPELGSMFSFEEMSFNFVKKSSYLKRGEIDNLIEDFGVLEVKENFKSENQFLHIKEFYTNLFLCNSFIINLVKAYDEIICGNNNLSYSNRVVLEYNKDRDMVLEFYDFLLTSKNSYSKSPEIIKFIQKGKDNYLFELDKFETKLHKDKFYTNNLKEPEIYNNNNILRFLVDTIVTDYVIKQSFMYTYTGENKRIYDLEVADELKKKSQLTELLINMENVREFLTISKPNNMLLPIIINLISLKIKTKNVPIAIFMDYKTIKNKINEDEVINLIYNLYNTILIKVYDRLKNSEYIKEFVDVYNIHTNMIIYEKIRKHVIVRLRSLQSQNKDSIDLLTKNGYALHIKIEQLVKVVLARLTFKGKFTKDIIGFISQIIQREFQYFFNREFKIKKLEYTMPDDIGDDNSSTAPHIDNAAYDALIRLDSSKRMLFLNDIESIKRTICRKYNLEYDRITQYINLILNNNDKYVPSRFSLSVAAGIYALFTGNTMLSTFLSLSDILFIDIALSLRCMNTEFSAIQPFFLTSIDPDGKRPSNIDNIVNKSTSILKSLIGDKAFTKENNIEYIIDNSLDYIIADFKQTLTKPLISHSNTLKYGRYMGEIMGEIVTNKDNIIKIVMNYISCRDVLISELMVGFLSIQTVEGQENGRTN